jgi:predicted transcriptional regulator
VRSSRYKNKKNYLLAFLLAPLLIIFAALAFSRLPKYVNKVVDETTKISEYNLLAQNFLGLDKRNDILILFMNNAEQRYGGGFVGSLGYISMDKGKIKPDPVREVYYYDYFFKEANYQEKSADPTEGEVLYSLRDSGQSLDWPANAKRADIIFERLSKKNVNTVLGVTPEVLKYLIQKTGPIELKDYKLTVTDSNITETIQQQVEFGMDKKQGKDPKTILTSIVTVLLERLQQKNITELKDLALGLEKLAESRQILVYSSDYEVSQLLKKYKLDGSLESTSADYFLTSEKNLSIDKSNAFIDRKINRSFNILEDGSVEVTAKLIRNQTVPVSFPYYDPNVPDVLTHVIRKNKSFIKIALPKKTQIIDYEGATKLEFRGSEGGYDIYGFQSDLEPLVPSEYSFKYKLPFKLVGENTFQLDSYIQYPNGGWKNEVANEFVAPKGWSLKYSNQPVKQSSGKAYYNEKVDKDIQLKLIYEKK